MAIFKSASKDNALPQVATEDLFIYNNVSMTLTFHLDQVSFLLFSLRGFFLVITQQKSFHVLPPLLQKEPSKQLNKASFTLVSSDASNRNTEKLIIILVIFSLSSYMLW